MRVRGRAAAGLKISSSILSCPTLHFSTSSVPSLASLVSKAFDGYRTRGLLVGVSGGGGPAQGSESAVAWSIVKSDGGDFTLEGALVMVKEAQSWSSSAWRVSMSFDNLFKMHKNRHWMSQKVEAVSESRQ